MATDQPGYDVAEIRSHFPALALTQDGERLAFFDGPGGTQVPREVIDAVSGYYTDSNANDGGAFLTSQRSDEVIRRAHLGVAEFLNARSGHEIKFGANMTTLTFHISRSIGKTLKPGDEIVVTTLDHEANVSPWRAMAEDRDVIVRTVDIHPEDGTLDLDDLDRQLSDRTRLVAVGYASNALGTINPVAEIIRRAHAAGALSYIDAVHFAPHGPIDVQALDTDFLVCSAYKFFGPHLGALYGKEAVLEGLPAYKVRPAHDRFETGTPNFEAIAGALAAIDYLAWVGERFGGSYAGEFPGLTGRRLQLKTAMRVIRAYEMDLFRRLVDGLDQIPGAHLWGIADRARFAERTPTAALTFDGLTPRAAAEALGRLAMTAWDGDFYAQALIERLGLFETGGVLRIGLAHYNTAEEVDRLVAALADIVGSANARPASA
jgi:cysteine desulfurase family protein (TIGR01976 family)